MSKKSGKSKNRTNLYIVGFSITVVTLLLALTVYRTQFLSFMPSSASSETSTSTAAAASADARYRYDERRTGVSLSKDIPTLPKLAWQYTCGYQSGSEAPPAVTVDTVYFMCDGNTGTGQGLRAFDINTGAQKWYNPLTTAYMGQTVCATPFTTARMELVGGVIYTNLCGGTVAINASNGSLKWKSPFPSGYKPASVSVPVVGVDRVFVSGGKNTEPYSSYVDALKLTDGTPLAGWRKIFPGPSQQDLAATIDLTRLVLGGGGQSGPGSTEKAMVQLLVNADTNTPTIKWSRTITTPGGFFRLNAPTALRNGVMYVGGNDWYVHALDRNTGADLWPPFKAGGPVSARMTLGQKKLMFADTANLYALGNDPATPATYGKQIWKKSIGTAGIVPSVSMTTGGYVYTGNHAGEVKAFRISNGNLMWTTPGTSDSCGPTSDQTPCNDVTEVVIAQGRVFAANARGHLRVFKP